jgi:hypothetical protein
MFDFAEGISCMPLGKNLCLIPWLCICLISIAAAAQSIPVPLIYQPLLPDTVAPGSTGFRLTLNGSGFVSGAVVNWNGQPRMTTFVSANKLQASINTADVAAAGTATITVLNPRSKHPSQPVYFSIQTPLGSVAMAFDGNLNATGTVTSGDFNNDGKLDVALFTFVSNVSSIQVFFGNGDGTFQAPITTTLTSASGTLRWLLAADFNGDGNLDLALSVDDQDNPYTDILLGDGTGKFSPALQQNYIYGLAYGVGDFNGDGRLDLIENNFYECAVLLGNGDGTFQQKNDSFFECGDYPGIPAVGDFNRDGKLDLAVPNSYGTSSVDVFLGNGNGAFQSVHTYAVDSGNELVAADFNGDGKLDLITNGVSVLFGRGDGTFSVGPTTALPGSPQASQFGVADFNGDGKPDIGMVLYPSSGTNNQQAIAVLLGNGDGTFQSPILTDAGAGGTSGVGMGDFNNDGKMDFYVGTVLDYYYPGSTMLFLQSSLSVSVNTLAFTDQNLNTTAPAQSITLTNITTAAVPIQGIAFTGAGATNFAQTNNCGTSLTAEASCQIQVTFTPTVTGTLNAALTISYAGMGGPQSIAVTGIGVSIMLSVAPASLTFPTQVIGTNSSTQYITLVNTGDFQTNISSIATTGPFQQMNNCPSSLYYTGDTCDIVVTFSPTTKGPVTGTISITDSATGSPQTVTLSGSGSAVLLSAVSVNFGNQSIGTSSTTFPIQLFNKGNTTLAIIQIAITGTNASDFSETNTCGTAVMAKSSCTINVTFTPGATGLRSAALSIADNGGGSPQSVGLFGTGD